MLHSTFRLGFRRHISKAAFVVALFFSLGFGKHEPASVAFAFLLSSSIALLVHLLVADGKQSDTFFKSIFVIVSVGWVALTITLLTRRDLITSCPTPLDCPAAVSTPAPLSQPNLAVTGEHRLAVVFPFIHKQVERLFSSIKSWSKHKTCRLDGNNRMASGAQVSILFYFDQQLNEAPLMADGSTVNEFFERSWRALDPSITSCFTERVRFVEAGLTAQESNRHPDGPCAMHFKLHTLLAGEFDHFFQMEPDVIPIQDFWLDRVVEEAAENGVGCTRWWMKGSLSRCDGRYGDIANRRDFHINGNALYCLGSSQFIDFINRVQVAYPAGSGTGKITAGCATGKRAEEGWDHTFYQFRMQPQNFEYAKHIMHRFQYASFIANLCEDEYSAEEILSIDPRTVLVHSKFPMLSADEQWVRRAYIRILGRYAFTGEVNMIMKPSLLSPYSIKDRDSLTQMLCTDKRRLDYLRELDAAGTLTSELLTDCGESFEVVRLTRQANNDHLLIPLLFVFAGVLFVGFVYSRFVAR